MASVLSSVTNAAHAAATTLLSATQVKPGSQLPTSATVKEDNAEQPFKLDSITGKSIIVGVPGAFTGTCTRQIPGYIEAFDKFKERGVQNIYVVAVNDVFVMKAWKESLAPSGTPVHFIADDTGSFVGSLGLLFDASPKLGAPRSKRFVIIADGLTISQVIVEPVPSELTVTAADKVLSLL